MALRTAIQFINQRGLNDGIPHPPRRMTPLVIDPLPIAHRRGLIAVAVTSLLSVITTTCLFFFISYRLIFWRKHSQTYIGYNQYVILIYNLLLADFQEALGFFLSAHWVLTDSISYQSPICPMQGWLLQIGDPASGVFVLAIAIHTFLIVVMGRKMSHHVFISFVVGFWIFCLLLVVIPTAMYGRNTYAPSGAWCWIDEKHEAARLWGHYFWIFVSEFGSIAVYGILFFYLRRQVASSPLMGRDKKEHLRRLRRVTGYMVLYPLAYIVLSLPLAAGRMAMARGNKLNIVYFCVAGAFISSSGFVDVIMYTLTRRALLLDSQPSNFDRRYASGRYQANNSHIATVTVENRASRIARRIQQNNQRRRASGYPDCESSMDSIVFDQPSMEMLGLGMGKVYQKTTIEVTSEPVEEGVSSTESSRNPSRDLNPLDPISAPGKAWVPPK